MKSFKSVVDEAMSNFKAGKITHMLDDPAINIFRILYTQQNEVQRLKKETIQHIWCRPEKSGKIELAPLDDEFSSLQHRIASLETKIAANEKVAENLEKAFTELQIEPSFIALEGQSRKIHGEIDRVTHDLNVALTPYRLAAEKVHADVEAIPEVIQLREEAAAKVALLENKAMQIDETLEKIRAILMGVRN